MLLILIIFLILYFRNEIFEHFNQPTKTPEKIIGFSEESESDIFGLMFDKMSPWSDRIYDEKIK